MAEDEKIMEYLKNTKNMRSQFVIASKQTSGNQDSRSSQIVMMEK